MSRPAKTRKRLRPTRARRTPAPDVLIIGGGVMGSACAWRLAKEGASVTVLERSVPGAEASSAAAGIIGPSSESAGPGPSSAMMRASAAQHSVWARALFDATGIEVGYRQNGILRVEFARDKLSALKKSFGWQRRVGYSTRNISGDEVARLEPALTRVAGGVYFEEDGKIDPPLFFRAVHVAAVRAKVAFRSGTYVQSVAIDGGRAAGVVLEDGSKIEAGAVIVAAGSWTTLVGGTALGPSAVVPARGQIVELETSAPLLERIVLGPRCYVVPRPDGRMLVGSTLEFVGYRREVTARAVRDLLDAALALVPGLEAAAVRSMWSNFRPYTADELPLLGATDTPGLFLATGHYRTGILLAPITAECLTAVVMGKRPPVDLAPFRAGR